MAGLWDWVTDNAWNIAGAAGNIGGGIAGYYASKNAADAQRDAANAAAANFRPYAELGDYAAGELQGRLNNNALLKNFSTQDFKKDPGYQFRLDEGSKAIDRAAGARGSRYSGATLKALQRFSQDYASGEYGKAYDRHNTNRTMNYNFLAGPAQLGVGAQGQVGSYIGNAGDARAAGTIGGANALWGGFNDAYNTINRNRYQANNPYIMMMPGG